MSTNADSSSLETDWEFVDSWVEPKCGRCPVCGEVISPTMAMRHTKIHTDDLHAEFYRVRESYKARVAELMAFAADLSSLRVRR